MVFVSLQQQPQIVHFKQLYHRQTSFCRAFTYFPINTISYFAHHSWLPVIYKLCVFVVISHFLKMKMKLLLFVLISINVFVFCQNSEGSEVLASPPPSFTDNNNDALPQPWPTSSSDDLTKVSEIRNLPSSTSQADNNPAAINNQQGLEPSNNAPSPQQFQNTQFQNQQIAEPPNEVINQVGTPIIGKGSKIDQGISYQRIRINGLQKKYLFFNFNLAEKDSWQKVDILITQEGNTKVLNKCENQGVDSCYLPNYTLKENTTLFILIQCQDDCTYNIKAHWSDLEHLIPNQQIIFIFGKETTQIYHVELEAEKQFEEVRIHLAPRVTRKPFDNIKIYGNYGKAKEPTFQKHDFQSINLWQDGQGVFLKKSQMKQKTLTLLIVGQAETTYRLLLEVIKQPHHQIDNGEHLYEYIKTGQTKTYSIQFNPSLFEEYSLAFSTLSGEKLEIEYFTDKQFKNKLSLLALEYMGDSQYIFGQNIIKSNPSGLFIRVKSMKRDGTYTMKYIGRKNNDPVQLNEHVYGFIPIKQTKFAYFDFKRWISETELKQNLKFTTSIIGVIGKTDIEFMICQSTLNLCTSERHYINVTQQIPLPKHDDISQKQIFNLQISEKVLTKINSAQQQATLIIRLISKQPDEKFGYSLVAIELINQNKVLYLRQSRPLEEKLAEREMKIYKYINSDPNVQEIRIHINEIVGSVNFYGVIQSAQKTNSKRIQPQFSMLKFTENLTQPIYASVTADSKAIFGITMQIIHKSQGNQRANIIKISQDVTYTVQIQPNSYSIFQVVPIFYDFSFSYTASQSVIVCALNQTTNTCIDGSKKDDSSPNLNVKGELTNVTLVDRKARIKITNLFGDSTAEVSFIFHSRLFNHCETKSIGQVYNQVVKDNTCFSYLIEHQNKNIELYISKREFANLNYQILLCGNNLGNASSLKTVTITPSQVDNLCKGSLEGKRLSIIWAVATKGINKYDNEVRVDCLAQYSGEVIMLTQGVSYNKIIIAKEGILSKFAFKLLNVKKTKIILNQIRGIFKIFAKLVKHSQRQKQQISQINYHVSSLNTLDYNQQPTIIISADQIESYQCGSDCSILIAVYSIQEMIGSEVEFDIQVVQRFEVLHEDSAVQGYLEAGSFAYYSYSARGQENSTIVILLSDHNQQCANIYVSLLENPGPNSHIAKAIGSNQLVLLHYGGERRYSVAVEATKTCDYSISVLTVDSSIHNLKRGKQMLIKLPKGVTKYFSIDHYTNEEFKIITLLKYGQIKLYLNRSSINIDRKSFTRNELSLDKFQFKSEQSNVIAVDHKSPYFCEKCNYFLAIESVQDVEATLYLAYPQTLITLAEGHIFSDYLKKIGDYTLASYKRLDKTQIKLKIHSGSLRVVAVYKQKTINQTFSAKETEQTLEIDFSSQASKTAKNIPEADPYLGQRPEKPATVPIERIPVNLLFIAASENVVYTLQMKSMSQGGNIDKLAKYQSVIAGEPNHIEISSEKSLCLTGYLRSSDQELILSANNDNRKYFNSVIMQATINGQKADIQKKFSQNIIGITIKDKKQTSKQSRSYSLCLKLSQASKKSDQSKLQQKVVEADKDDEQIKFTASITQSNSVNILQSDIEFSIKGTATFLIHSEGEFLLDVFECKGESKVVYGSSLSKIEKSKSKGLDLMSIADQRHAIKVSQKQVTFVKVESEHSIVRWLPIDYDNDRGLGYLKFSTGDLKYTSRFKEISLQYQPLKLKKQSTANVKDIEYYLHVSNSSEQLQFSTQCESTQANVRVYPLGSTPPSSDSQVPYKIKNIEKEQFDLLFKGSQNIYFNIVCKLTLEANPQQGEKSSRSDAHQHYKFIYSRQQIPLATYQPNQIQSMPYHFLIILVVSIAVLLILCTYLFTRKIVPLIARLRSSNLVEQEPGHKDDIQIPASSDRNQRAPDIAIDTEEKMGQ